MGLVGAMFGWVFFYRIILEDREGLLIVRAVEDGCYVQQICGSCKTGIRWRKLWDEK